MRAAAQRQDRRRDAKKIKAGYPEIFARCQETFACFLHTPDPRGAFEVSDEEREAFYEKLYGERGFGIWQGNFQRHPDRPQGQRHDHAISSRARSASG